MAILQPNEYDASYFDGKLAVYSHNAGYTKYTKWYRINNDFLPHNQSTGEYWKDLAKRLMQDYSLVGKKILDIGCAKGYVVEGLRDFNVDAYGIDVSEYAINEAEEKVKPYLTVADVRIHLKNYEINEFDFIFSRWTMGCFSEEDLPNLISEMNRISKLQFHIIDTSILPQYYNRKPIEEWLKMSWKKGTIITPYTHFKKLYSK